MPTKEIPTKPCPVPYIPPSFSSLRRRRSGYEPSDTESEWFDSPWNEAAGGAPANSAEPPRSGISPPVRPAITPPRSQSVGGSSTSLVRTPRKPSPLPRDHSSRLPHEPAAEPVESGRDGKNHIKHDKQRHVSPYRTMARAEPHDLRGGDDDADNGSFRRRSQRMTPPRFREDGGIGDDFRQVSRVSETSSYRSRRSKSAPKSRDHAPLQPQQQPPPVNSARRQGHSLGKPQVSAGQRQNPSASEIKEATESIALDGIFFSHHGKAIHKNPTRDDGRHGGGTYSTASLASDRNGNARLEQQRSNRARDLNRNAQIVTVGSILSRADPNRSSSVSAVSRHGSSSLSKDSSRTSDVGSGSFRKFTANRQKAHIDSWFSCVRGRTCRRSKSPDTRAVHEASYINKAFVVEELRQFWADKHRPRSLSGFICHKQQAQQLQKLISYNRCPHIILRGPPGSGKRSLALAFLHEIFGDSSEKISHELRQFLVQENRSKVAVPLTSSPHHVELDIKSKTKNARYALMGLVKEMANNHAIIPEVSDSSFKAEYKVIVMYANDKIAENIQHLIKWVMDGYTDICKIILCCEDENHILESVRSRCKVINVDAPETHEIAEVLLQIAKKENFELSMGFATKIATISNKNLRKAIMALESCKTYSYPFVDEQPIPIGWEETLVEIASEVLADPSPKRLFYIRGKLQKLLVESVHPKLVLQKLVEEFLKGVQVAFRREIYYWHAYYDKRLPTGTTALLKLEEFVAKFMSIQRRGSPGRQAV